MKKFFKLGAVLTAILCLACFVGCKQNDDGEETIKVSLTGSTSGYCLEEDSYYGSGGNYLTKGYLDSSLYVYENSSNATVASFRISVNTLYITIQDGKTLSTGSYIDIYNSSSHSKVGRVTLTKNDGKYKLTYNTTYY